MGYLAALMKKVRDGKDMQGIKRHIMTKTVKVRKGKVTVVS